MILRPVSTLLAPSRSVGVACAFCPTFTVLGEIVTLMLATGTCVTVISEDPVWPSLVAVIVVVPTFAAAAVTKPLAASTVATPGLLEDQVTARVRTLLCASFNTTVSCSVPP